MQAVVWQVILQIIAYAIIGIMTLPLNNVPKKEETNPVVSINSSVLTLEQSCDSYKNKYNLTTKLTEENRHEVLCAIYLSNYEYNKQSGVVLNAAKTLQNHTVETICKNRSILLINSNYSKSLANLIPTDRNCERLCTNINLDIEPLCSAAYYLSTISNEKHTNTSLPVNATVPINSADAKDTVTDDSKPGSDVKDSSHSQPSNGKPSVLSAVPVENSQPGGVPPPQPVAANQANNVQHDVPALIGKLNIPGSEVVQLVKQSAGLQVKQDPAQLQGKDQKQPELAAPPGTGDEGIVFVSLCCFIWVNSVSTNILNP